MAMARNKKAQTDFETVPIIAPSALARALRAARRDYGLTVREAAQLAGVSAATYSRIERQSDPDVYSLLRLSSFVFALRRDKLSQLIKY